MASYIRTTIDLDVNRLKRKYDGKLNEAQNTLNTIILRDCEQYIPLDRGDLRASGDTLIREGRTSTVIWDIEYARNLYWGYYGKGKKMKLRTPGTHFQWFKYAKSLHLRDWLAAVQL